MKSFNWRAYTDDGTLKTGLSVAADRAEVSSKLKAEGLFPEQIDEANERTLPRFGGKRLDGDMQAVLARQLAVLIGSGLPVDEASTVLEQRTFKAAVDEDWQKSRQFGITGVPTFVAGGYGVTGAQPYETLVKFVQHVVNEGSS